MAENDKRIESLEDEVKVLKGEVKRTLVDLRALLMREDSPLNEAASLRRSAGSAKPPAEDPLAKKEVVKEQVQQIVAAATPPPAPLPAPPQPPPPPPQPAPVANWPTPQPAFPTAGPGPGMPPPALAFRAATEPGLGPSQHPSPTQSNPASGPSQPPHYSAPPGPPTHDQQLAEQERRLAQQERMLAQQEREFAQQSRNHAREEQDDRPGKRAKREDAGRTRGDEPGQDPKGDQPVRQVDPSLAFPWSPGLEVRSLGARPDRIPEEELEQPRRRQDEGIPPVRAAQTSTRQRQDPAEEEEQPTRQERNERRRSSKEEKPEPSANGKGSRVFEEYWELLDEATVQSASDESAGASPMDVNVIASLVYWVSMAKRRLGDQKLRALLELYLQSGHSRPGLQELLLHLHTVVDPPSPAAEGAGQSNLEMVDLMFQLHGILTGGLPIGRMPLVALAPNLSVAAPALRPLVPQFKPVPVGETQSRVAAPPVVAVD